MYHLNLRAGELPRSASSHFLDMVIFFLKKIIVGPQEAQNPQFLLQLPLTHYILRAIFFRTHSTPPICLKTQKCAILSTFLESGGKNNYRAQVNLGSDSWVPMSVRESKTFGKT